MAMTAFHANHPTIHIPEEIMCDATSHTLRKMLSGLKCTTCRMTVSRHIPSECSCTWSPCATIDDLCTWCMFISLRRNKHMCVKTFIGHKEPYKATESARSRIQNYVSQLQHEIYDNHDARVNYYTDATDALYRRPKMIIRCAILAKNEGFIEFARVVWKRTPQCAIFNADAFIERARRDMQCQMQALGSILDRDTWM